MSGSELQRKLGRPRARAEAAAWLARLHGPHRSPDTERGFKAWLAADPAHAQAFEEITDTWEGVAGIASGVNVTPRHRPVALRSWVMACVLSVVAVIALSWNRWDPRYDTSVGEQKRLVLSDGSRVTLNTNSRVAVEYRDKERRIRLDHGEVLFEVAKNPARPFVVIAGGNKVRALGTTFLVRNEDDAVAVTLIEGRVSVTDEGQAQAATVLRPGQRLSVDARANSPAIDRPALDVLTAWRRGEVVFEDATLADAIKELNRYSEHPLALADPQLGRLHVSGVFATGNTAEFAAAVARLHDLSVAHEDEGIVLSR